MDTVRALMTDRVVAVTSDLRLEAALRLMTTHRIRHLPVMDGDHCVGLLHEVDVLWTLWTHGDTGRTAGRCCRQPAPTVSPDDPMTTVAARMARDGSDAALVVTGGSIIGIVTAADIIHHLGATADS
jgi:CBS domain-containing protein